MAKLCKDASQSRLLAPILNQAELDMEDIEYHRKRLRQEEQAAQRATSREAEMIHRSLAAHYARKAIVTLVAVDDGVQKG